MHTRTLSHGSPLRCPNKQVAAWYTVVIFTASIQEYADPVIDWLDGGKGLVTARLFREVSDTSIFSQSDAFDCSNSILTYMRSVL